ncbi:allergen Api m 6.03 / Api m 6.04-like [Gastrophryne carolinensis]
MKAIGVLCIFALALHGLNARSMPKFCEANEERSDCGGNISCQRTCQNLNEEAIMCNKMCMPGCVCVKGYVLRSYDDRVCIPIQEC